MYFLNSPDKFLSSPAQNSGLLNCAVHGMVRYSVKYGASFKGEVSSNSS